MNIKFKIVYCKNASGGLHGLARLHEFAFISVLEEFTGDKKPGTIFSYEISDIINYICYICYIHFVIHSLQLCPAWLEGCESTIVYECKMQSQVIYVIPITWVLALLSRISVVPGGGDWNDSILHAQGREYLPWGYL